MIFTPQCYADSAVLLRQIVCPSETLMYCDHIQVGILWRLFRR